MPTVNEELRDQAIAHAIWLRRYGGGLAKRLIAILEKADADLVAKIAARLEKLGLIEIQEFGKGKFTTQRLQALLAEIRELSGELRVALSDTSTKELNELAKIEVAAAAGAINETVRVDLAKFLPSPEQLRSIVTSQPFHGKLLRDWFRDMESWRVRQAWQGIQIGLVENQTTPQIVRRVRDTLNVSKAHATAIARTSVTHVATRARDFLYQANADVIKGVKWVSVLDARTTPICRARDGKVFPLHSGPRPPAHVNCRSTVTPITYSWDELDKTGRLKRGRGSDDIDTLFTRALKAKGFTDEQIATIKRDTRASMTGQVPKDTTYNEWLKTQPVYVQDDVLGKRKGQLFRKGGLTMDQFVDRAGHEYTLAELRAKYSEAWERAGLD